MTADIDAVLSRLRERPECRDAVEVIERLRGWKADALVVSPVPDEPTSDESFEHVGHGEGMSMFIGHVSGCPACEATRRKMLDEQTERFMERVKADAQPGPKHAAAPSHPTGEERRDAEA